MPSDSRPIKMTPQMVSLLGALLEDPTAELYGFELCKRAGLKSGTIYPALGRLTNAGWLEHRWEELDPASAGRPRRRLYKLTGEGETTARKQLDQLFAEVDRARRRSGRGTLGVAPA